MSWFLRMAMTIPQAYLRPKVAKIGEIEEKTFQVLPTDIDIMGHMNNSQYFVCMEMMRWDYTVRTGFGAYAAKRKWALPIAGQVIRYHRPMKLFQKFTVSGQIIYQDDKWWFWEHHFHSKGKLVAHAMVKTTVKGPQGTVPASAFLSELGFEPLGKPMPEKIVQWMKLEEENPSGVR